MADDTTQRDDAAAKQQRQQQPPPPPPPPPVQPEQQQQQQQQQQLEQPSRRQSQLFNNVKFIIAQRCNDADQVRQMLLDGGAKHINYLSESVTHVIADSNCPEAEEAVDLYDKPVVRSLWVYLCQKVNRLLPAAAFSPIRSIFHNVVASFSADLPPSDINTLAASLTFYGAKVTKNPRNSTHFIVSSAHPSDGPSITTNTGDWQSPVFVVPVWVLDSIKQKSRCDERLYDPSLLKPQPRLTPPPTPSIPSDNKGLTTEANENEKDSTASTSRSSASQFNANASDTNKSLDVDDPSLGPTILPELIPGHPFNPREQQQQQQLRQHARASQLPRPRTAIDFIRAPQPRFRPLLPPNSNYSNMSNQQQQAGHQVPQQQQLQRSQTDGLNVQHQDSQQQPKMIVDGNQQQQHHIQRRAAPYQGNVVPQQPHQQPVVMHPRIIQQAPQQQLQQQHTNSHPTHHPQAPPMSRHPQQPHPQQHPHSQYPAGSHAPQSHHPMPQPQPVPGNMVVQPSRLPQPTMYQQQQQPQQQLQPRGPYQNNHMVVRGGGPMGQQPPQHVQIANSHPQQQQPQQPQMVARIQDPKSPHMTMQRPYQVAAQPQQGSLQPQPQTHQSQPLQPQKSQPMQYQPQSVPIQRQPHYYNQAGPSGHHQTMPVRMAPQQGASLPRHLMQHGDQQVVYEAQQLSPNHPHPPPPNQFQQTTQHPAQHSFQNQATHQQPSSHPLAQQFPTHQQPMQQVQQQQHTPPSQHQHQPMMQQQLARAPNMMQARAQISPNMSVTGHPIAIQQVRAPRALIPIQSQEIRPGTGVAIVRSQGMTMNQQQQGPHPQPIQTQAQLQQPQLTQQTSGALISPSQARPVPSSSAVAISQRPPLPPVPSTTMKISPQPHPSIFDSKQGSDLASIKARVPVVAESFNYYGHDSKENIPKDAPFSGCRFKMVDYDDTHPKLRQKWCDTIKAAGGTFEEPVEHLTHLICENRLSETYQQAAKAGVRCVSIYWINDVLAQGRLFYPWKALHFPLPYNHDDKPLENQTISLTNFKGRERREVKEMILKTGASYTDYFSTSNTLIICGNVGGDKYDRAVEWRIPIANCLIISDVLMTGNRDLTAMLKLSKYQLFNNGNQLKLRSYQCVQELMNAWKVPISFQNWKNSGAIEAAANNSTSAAGPLNTNEDSGVATGGSTNSDSDTARLKSDESTDINGQPENKQPNVDNDVREAGQNSLKRESEADLKIKQESSPNQVVSMEVDQDAKVVKTEPPVSSGTDATDGSREEVKVNGLSPKPPDEKMDVIKESAENTAEPSDVATKSKMLNSSSPKFTVRTSTEPVRILFTYIDHALLEDLETFAYEMKLGITTKPSQCTHLIVERISQTPKFICAFNHASYILSYKWIVESHNANNLLDEKHFLLQDSEGEEKYSFNLVYSLLKRRKRGKPLFDDMVFFVTPSIMKTVPNVRDMIESAGGLAETRKLPSKAQLDELQNYGRRFIVITCPPDFHLCKPLQPYSSTVDYVDVQFIISGILRQDIDFEAHRLRPHPETPPLAPAKKIKLF